MRSTQLNSIHKYNASWMPRFIRKHSPLLQHKYNIHIWHCALPLEMWLIADHLFMDWRLQIGKKLCKTPRLIVYPHPTLDNSSRSARTSSSSLSVQFCLDHTFQNCWSFRKLYHISSIWYNNHHVSMLRKFYPPNQQSIVCVGIAEGPSSQIHY